MVNQKNAFYYSKNVRLIEYISLYSFCLLWIFNFNRAFHVITNEIILLLISIALSWISADFISGIVHWFADTWGTGKWPILGPSLIRSFREHHVDPLSITRHDFIETNGMNAMISLPILIVLTFILPTNNKFLFLFLLFFTVWILFTNQFHKWGHQKKLPSGVTFFQKSGIILSQQNHARHHSDNHSNYYFITSGFLNDYVGEKFFRFSEKMITQLTGLTPREDDSFFLSEKYNHEKDADPKMNPDKTSKK